jgi:K+-transporting ATPase KdpF subunit
MSKEAISSERHLHVAADRGRFCAGNWLRRDMRPALARTGGPEMESKDGTFEPIHRVERRGDVQIVLDDERQSENRQPVTIRIIVMEKEQEAPFPMAPRHPLVRVIHEDELAQWMEERTTDETREAGSMTFGESVTLLIAIGVLIYLIYALLWPERF